MKYIVMMILWLLLPFTAEAATNNHVTPPRAAMTAAAPADNVKIGRKIWNGLGRMLGRKPKQPQIAQAKPDTPPPRVTPVRQPSGQRPAPRKSSEPAANRPKPSGKPELVTVERAKAAPLNPFATSPKAEAEDPKWRPRYSKTTLGKAMDQKWDTVVAESVMPTRVEVQEIASARVTAFNKGDVNSANRKSATAGIALREAIPGKQIGIMGVPTEYVGSYIKVTINGEEHVYFGADIGTDVESAKAAAGQGMVVDLFSKKGQQWENWKSVEIISIYGAAHPLLMPPSERKAYLEWSTFQRACALASNG